MNTDRILLKNWPKSQPRGEILFRVLTLCTSETPHPPPFLHYCNLSLSWRGSIYWGEKSEKDEPYFPQGAHPQTRVLAHTIHSVLPLWSIFHCHCVCTDFYSNVCGCVFLCCYGAITEMFLTSRMVQRHCLLPPRMGISLLWSIWLEQRLMSTLQGRWVVYLLHNADHHYNIHISSPWQSMHYKNRQLYCKQKNVDENVIATWRHIRSTFAAGSGVFFRWSQYLTLASSKFTCWLTVPFFLIKKIS